LNCGVLGSQGHLPAKPGDNRGELVLSIVEGNPLGDAKLNLRRPHFLLGLFYF